jgi:hypothetical protein
MWPLLSQIKPEPETALIICWGTTSMKTTEGFTLVKMFSTASCRAVRTLDAGTAGDDVAAGIDVIGAAGGADVSGWPVVVPVAVQPERPTSSASKTNIIPICLFIKSPPGGEWSIFNCHIF